MTPEALERLHAMAFKTPRPWNAAEFAALLSSPLVFVVGDSRSFAMGRVILDEAELLTIATHPANRRQGFGKLQLAALEAQANARGAKTVFLEVSAENHAAIGLYSAAGYHEAGRRTAYYATPEGKKIDALILQKQLP